VGGIAAAADVAAASESGDAALVSAAMPFAAVSSPAGPPAADSSVLAVPVELAAPDSAVAAAAVLGVPVAGPPAPARGETGAESPAPGVESDGLEAAAVAAAAAAAAANGDALPSPGKEAPPDAPG